MAEDQKEIDSKMLAELHVMASEIVANSSGLPAQDIRNRMAAVSSGGYDFADTLHNIYLDYGYPARLAFNNYWNMYRRFGIAKNVIELPVNTGWSTPPRIESSNASMLKDLEKLNRRINLWIRFKGLDTRQRVGRYAGMFMQVKDSKKPELPIEGTLPGEAAIVNMIPLYESQLKVSETDQDPQSETFGQPILVEYNQSALGGRNDQAASSITIHASRIVFVAEGADNGQIYGIPALEAVYNSLMDLRKIIGGGAEGFYKNAAQNAFFNLSDPKNSSGFTDKLAAFNKQYTDFTQDRFNKSLWGPGMEMNMMDSKLVQPKEFFNNALNDVAAGSTPVIPATVLIGQQTGRLASDEDSVMYLQGIQSRREDFQTEMTRANIDWLMKFGILPTAEYEVVWDDLLERSDKDKLLNSETMAGINEKQFKSGGQPVFTEVEIRDQAGFEEEPLEDIGGEDGDDPDDNLEE